MLGRIVEAALTQRAFAIICALFLCAGGGYAFYRSAEDARVRDELAKKELAAKQAQLDKLMTDLKTQNDAIAAAQAEAASAKSEADKNAAQAKLLAAQEQQKRTQANIAAVRAAPAGGGGASKPSTPKPACTCQAGDPLCSCL